MPRVISEPPDSLRAAGWMEAKVSEKEFTEFKRGIQTSMSHMDRSAQAATEEVRAEARERSVQLESRLHDFEVRLKDAESAVDEIWQIMEPDELSDGTEVYGEEEDENDSEDELSQSGTELSSVSSSSSSTSDSGDSESDREYDDRGRPRYDTTPYNEPQPGPYEYPY